MTEDSAPRRDRRVFLLLWLLPLWLLLSSGIGMWLYFKKQAAAEAEGQPRFTTALDPAKVRDDMEKLLGFVGERHASSPAGVQGLNRAGAMIEGSLGPGNAGYAVERVRGPAAWPLPVAVLEGREASLPPVWVVAAYDSRPGSPGAEANASGVASVLAAAHALAGAHPRRGVVFAFLPHGCDPDSPVAETAAILKDRIGGNISELLVVEATGSAAELLLSSRDAESRALRQAEGLGEVAGAEAVCLEDDFDLSALLFENGLPAVRVATRPVVKAEEADSLPPDPAVHAAATGNLIALIRRLSDS